MGSEQVILVDHEDRQIGIGDKQRVHSEGMLHRAFSVFVFNLKGEVMLQQRSAQKYHSGGLWANTCCSHARPDSDIRADATRRLKQEMGIRCDLEHVFTFQYRAPVGNGLVESEIDHVFFGRYEGAPRPDPSEVSDWRWVSLASLERDLSRKPGSYACWLRVCFPSVLEHYENGYR